MTKPINNNINLNPIHFDVEGQTEEALQQKMVFWFHSTYPEFRGCFFHVPNGDVRSKRAGARLKKVGVVAGVADMILLAHGGIWLFEVKNDKGTQSIRQIAWQKLMEKHGFTYILVRSLKQFQHYILELFKDW